jgi:hypothetical protein
VNAFLPSARFFGGAIGPIVEPIEIHQELTIMTIKHPTRHLLGNKPHHYVNAVSTDIRRTFRRFRLLARLQQKLQTA